MKEYLLLLFVLYTSATPLKPVNVGNAECHKVPKMCQLSPEYTKMRLPNMFNDTREKDVEKALEDWKPLLNSNTCNADNQLKYFLCFSYAPVCVLKLISPCKSLCKTVRDSCDPVLRKHNHVWPPYFDCDQPKKFPDDSSQMCINLMMIRKCSCKGNYTNETLRSLICKSDFVFSARVTKHNKTRHQIDAKPSRVFHSKPSLQNQVRAKSVRLEYSVTKENCHCNTLLRRKARRRGGRYLIIANTVEGVIKVQAIKRMENRDEIREMVKQC